jgi:cobalt/nickel transport system permease protein
MAVALLAFVLFLPAMIMNPSGIPNNLHLVLKVFFSLEMVRIFNHTTQWNHITAALRKLHIPGLFIFTLDMTLKYVVLLGTLIVDLLTALRFRSVGKNNKNISLLAGSWAWPFSEAPK